MEKINATRAMGFMLVLITVGTLLFPSSIRAGDEDCLTCHSDSSLTDASGRSLYVDALQFKGSVHGESGLTCTSCHTDLEGFTDFPHAEKLQKVNCGSCHDAAQEEYAKSLHGVLALEKDDPDAPRCSDCHGSHDVRPVKDPMSRVYPTNQPQTCSRCHTDEEKVARHDLPNGASFVNRYRESVHGRAVTKAGLIVAAVCSDCHGAHDMQSTKDPRSPVWRTHIPQTCGKCHAGILTAYDMGIHGQEFAKGNPDVPICTDCHGEHRILSPTEPASSVYPTHIATTCSKCHENEKLSKKYGLPSKRLISFIGTYHGVASEFGDVTVANCASCHGFHDILPSGDPRSSIYPANIPKTCGGCHPNAGANFAKGRIHVTEPREQNLGVYLVKKFYIGLIGSMVTGFVLLIGIDLFGRARRKRGHKHGI